MLSTISSSSTSAVGSSDHRLGLWRVDVKRIVLRWTGRGFDLRFSLCTAPGMLRAGLRGGFDL